MKMKQMKKLLLGFITLLLVCCVFDYSKAMAMEVECNVKSEGAKGDGVTDDTKAINKALAKAAALADGDTLVVSFPEGQYNINSLLKIYCVFCRQTRSHGGLLSCTNSSRFCQYFINQLPLLYKICILYNFMH